MDTNQNDNTTYDDVYRTMLNDCKELILPVVNEIFHENYTGKEEIIFFPDTHYLNQQDGTTKEKITDSYFEIKSETSKKYHIECQSTPDGSILIRFFEYDSQIALDHGELEDHCLTVTFPEPAVLYLRQTSATPDQMTLVIKTPGGDISYDIPIMKVQNYSVSELFEKKLLFLLPFYIFCYEKKLAEYEKNEEKRNLLKQEFTQIHANLDELCQTGEINEYEKCIILDMSKRVIAKLASKHQKVREEVKSIMGGKVLEHEAKTILNKGIAQGEIKGEIKAKLNQLVKKIQKNKPFPQIVSEMEEPETYVQLLYDCIMKVGVEGDLNTMVNEVLNAQREKTA